MELAITTLCIKRRAEKLHIKKNTFTSYKDLELTKRLLDIIFYAVHKDNVHTEIT
jgi:hypothetical protein